MAGQKAERALSWDLDDTLIARERITRTLGVLKSKIASSHLPSFSLDQLPEVSRAIVDVPIRGFAEYFSYLIHSRRGLVHGAQDIIEDYEEGGAIHFGNTGRSNKRKWVEMTERTLERTGIDKKLNGIFYTPEGIKTAVSKAAAIKTLKESYPVVEHFDDDPRTAVYLASLFPDVTVNLIQYSTSGLLYSREELAKFPNIKRGLRL